MQLTKGGAFFDKRPWSNTNSASIWPKEARALEVQSLKPAVESIPRTGGR